MNKTIQLIIIISLLSGCGGNSNIVWRHQNYSTAIFDADNNECKRKANELAQQRGTSQQQSPVRQTTPGLGGYTAATLNAAAADNLSNAIIGAINHARMYGPLYKECMEAKGYYEGGDISSLIKDLKDSDEKVRSSAVLSIGKRKDPHNVEILISVLQDREALVRAHAADALGKTKDNRAIKPLIFALSDEDSLVRINSALSLHAITGENFWQDSSQWLEWWEKNRAN